MAKKQTKKVDWKKLYEKEYAVAEYLAQEYRTLNKWKNSLSVAYTEERPKTFDDLFTGQVKYVDELCCYLPVKKGRTWIHRHRYVKFTTPLDIFPTKVTRNNFEEHKGDLVVFKKVYEN